MYKCLWGKIWFERFAMCKKMTFRNSGENKLTVTIMILYNDCPISIAYMWSLMLPWSWSSKGYRLVWNSKGGGNWSSEPERLHTGKGRHPTKKNYLKRALPVKLRSIDYQIDRVGYSCTALHSSVCPSRWLQPPSRRTQRTKSRGPKDFQLEVGDQRAPRFLVTDIKWAFAFWFCLRLFGLCIYMFSVGWGEVQLWAGEDEETILETDVH